MVVDRLFRRHSYEDAVLASGMALVVLKDWVTLATSILMLAITAVRLYILLRDLKRAKQAEKSTAEE